MRIPFGLVVEPYDNHLHGSPLQQYLDELAIAERRYFEKAKLETALHCFGTKDILSQPSDDVILKSSYGILPGQPLSDLQQIVESIQSTILSERSIAQVSRISQYLICLRFMHTVYRPSVSLNMQRMKQLFFP